MHRPQEQVRELHVAIGHDHSPAMPMLRVQDLRASLILEEAIETACALVGPAAAQSAVQTQLQKALEKLARAKQSEPNIIEAIDGCVDTLVVVYGTLEAIGVDVEPFFDEVHKANMAKASGPVREDGKRLKPEGWTPPDIRGVLARVHMEAPWKK